MGLIIAITLLITLMISVPIGMALGISAVVGILYLSPDFLIIFPQRVLGGLDSFPLLAIPLFILAGTIMGRGGIAERIVNLAMIFVGQIRGAMGMVAILSTMFFSGICGSASADTAAVGSITLPEMAKRKYPKRFSTALVAAAGGTSQLVPPSIDLIIIGAVANISIGGLFAAGIIPGIVNGIALMALTYFYAIKLDLPIESPIQTKEKFKIVREGLLSVLMAIIILGGIIGGIFTPTEASAVAVVYGFCVSFFVYKDLTFKDLPGILLHSCHLTGMVLLVLGMASAFSYVLTFDRIPHELGEWIIRTADNWVMFVIFVIVLFLLLGMIMDALPAIIILMPILVPAGVALGMEPIHIGILVQACVGVSLISPPVGVCLYVACGLSKITIEEVTGYLLPFLAVLVLTVIVISFVPEISLFLPRQLGYID